MAINVRQRDGVIIFEPTGRIIGKGVNELKKTLDAQLADAGEAPKILFDLSGVSMIDSSGLGTLMGTHLSILRQGGRFAVINVDTNIKNLIVINRLVSSFEHFGSEDEAIAGLTAEN